MSMIPLPAPRRSEFAGVAIAIGGVLAQLFALALVALFSHAVWSRDGSPRLLAAARTSGRSAAHAYRAVAIRGTDADTRVTYHIAPGSPPQVSTAWETGILEKINRRDREHLTRAERLARPNSWPLDERAYSQMPLRYAPAAGIPKFIVVHQPGQMFGGYEFGRLVRWGPVSSGREKRPTPGGHFHLNWRSKGRHSTVDPDWYMPWYFNFHNERGVSFHEYSLPGLPASHACVRLLERDAKWLFDWGETWTLDERGWNVLEPGTPVWIVGQYDFSAPPPWQSAQWLAGRVELPQIPALPPIL
jgi:lipoprotein-anchoring transpeptidase ErfK/SrfK